MVSQAREALRRLKERIRSPAASLWLDDARLVRRGGRTVLELAGEFQKSWRRS